MAIFRVIQTPVSSHRNNCSLISAWNEYFISRTINVHTKDEKLSEIVYPAMHLL